MNRIRLCGRVPFPSIRPEAARSERKAKSHVFLPSSPLRQTAKYVIMNGNTNPLDGPLGSTA